MSSLWQWFQISQGWVIAIIQGIWIFWVGWSIHQLQARLPKKRVRRKLSIKPETETRWNSLPDYEEPKERKKTLTADEYALKKDMERRKSDPSA